MKIVFDGGAFQQGISGGILNVAVNFLNAATKVDPAFSYVLLADPFFGVVNPDLLAKLDGSPEIVYRSVLKQPKHAAGLLTSRLGWQVLVDGEAHAHHEDGGHLEFAGEGAPSSIEILSRSARPCDVDGVSKDGRRLGFGFTTLEVEEAGAAAVFHFDDPRFEANNHGAEAEHRWTAGRLVVPPTMLPTRGPWRMRLCVPHRILYPLFEGALDAKLAPVWTELDRLARDNALRDLADDLRAIGAQAYFANHFLPVRPGGMPLFSWAYDISPVVRPHFFDRQALDNFAEVVKVLTAADAAFCISRCTKTSIVEHLPIKEANFHVSWIGASPAIHRRDDMEVARLRERHGLHRPYIVCVATLEPRKNHVMLTEAYARLLDMMPEAPDLAVAGTRGWGYQAFFDKVAALGLGERVRHLEHLDDDEIAALYSGAELCVYPSLFEGFGLPVLEAMRCGVPVVTSRDTSMAEIAEGDAAVLIDPTSPDSIARGMEIVLRNPARRASLLARAAERVPAFEWETIARNILAVMEDHLR